MSTEDTNVIDIPQTPEDAAEQAPKEAPGYVGTLEEGEFNQLRSLQQASNQLVMQIGQIEVQKYNKLNTLAQIDRRAKDLMDIAATRFGVEPGQEWSVSPDGKVYLPGKAG